MALSSINNLLAAIWEVIRDRIPALSNGKIPVDVSSLNITVSNTSLEISNDVGNPVPISGTVTANTGLSQPLTDTQLRATAVLVSMITAPPGVALESGGNLAGINTKLPSNLTVTATRLLVDGSGVTQPVSFTTVPPGLAYLSTATITRSANTTAYTANDVYGNGSGGNAFELTNIGPSGGFVFLSSLDIIFNITALPSGMGAFAVYLFNAPPPSAITDNLPYSLSSGDRASIVTLNGFSLNASLARGGGSVVAEISNINQLFKLTTGSTSLWGYVVTLAAFTPAATSETATIRARSFAP
ncbi:MAG: hypothetical protein ACKPKQ_17845 [Dolichospermum sp.]